MPPPLQTLEMHPPPLHPDVKIDTVAINVGSKTPSSGRLGRPWRRESASERSSEPSDYGGSVYWLLLRWDPLRSVMFKDVHIEAYDGPIPTVGSRRVAPPVGRKLAIHNTFDGSYHA